MNLNSARGMVCACLMIAPLCLGGVHPVVNVLLAALLWGAVLLAVSQAQPLIVSGGAAVVWLALGCTVLQLIPIPMAWLHTIAPGSAAVWTAAAGDWHPMSVDPGATAHEVVKLTALAAAALLAPLLFRRRRRAVLGLFVAMAGLAVMAVGLVHALCEIPRPYGAFGAPMWFVASFINPNHLAGFLGLCTFVCLGRALESTGRLRRLLGTAGLLCALGVVLSLSRGGILALGVGFGFVLACQRTHSHRGFWTKCCGLTAGVALLVAYGPLVREFGAADGLNKFTLAQQAPTLWQQFPWFGMGRGSFATAFTRYVPADFPRVTLNYLENEWVQTLVDFGPLAGVAMIAALCMVVWQLRRRGAELGVAAAMVFWGCITSLILTCSSPLWRCLWCSCCAPMDAAKKWAPSAACA